MYSFLVSCWVILSTTLIFIQQSQGTVCGNETCTGCGNFNDPLRLSCHSGEVVTGVIKAGYRNKDSNDSSCIYKPHSDCFDEPSYFRLIMQIAACMWRKNECMFNNVAGRPKTGNCSMNTRAKYLVATHIMCVREQYLHTICVSKTNKLQSWMDTTKYILSAGLPNSYGQYKNPDYNETLCSVTIHADPGYGIRIYSIYMDLHKDDSIIISSDGYPEQKFNGRQEFEVIVSNSMLTVEFKINSGVHANVGFALRYTSFIPPREHKATTTTTSPLTGSEGPKTSMPVNNITPTQEKIKPKPRNTKNYSQLVMILTIVFVGVLVIAFVVALSCICFKRRGQKQKGVDLNRNNGIDDSKYNDTFKKTDVDTTSYVTVTGCDV